MRIYCGIDWAEAHHDVAVIDGTGSRLVKTRITDDPAGFTKLCRLLADAAASAESSKPAGGLMPVDVAIETDRGLLVAEKAMGQALTALVAHYAAPSRPSATWRSACRPRSSSTRTLLSWTACPDSASC